jgi:hypothetical protein
LEAKETANSQGKMEQKEQTRGITIPNFKLNYRAITIKQHSNAQKQTWKPVEQKTQIWIHTAMPTWFLTKVPKTYLRENTASLTNVAGKTGYPPVENWH